MNKAYAVVGNGNKDAFEAELDRLGKAGWTLESFALTGTPGPGGTGVFYAAVMSAEVDTQEHPRVAGGRR